MLYSLARAAITKYHRLHGLNDKFIFVWFWRLDGQGADGVGVFRGLMLVMTVFSLCLHMVFLCVSLSPNLIFIGTPISILD
jgi:hypothetical protein